MTTGPALCLFAAIATLLVLPLRANAEENRSVLSFDIENDLWGDGEDRWFTNGFRLAYAFAPGTAPKVLSFMARLLPSSPALEETDTFMALGQNIFTPDDITANRLIVDDRPFGGWFYGEIGASGGTATMQETLTLSLGVTGPPSLAKQTQKFIHDLTGSPDPKGWPFQIDAEPTLQLYYERAWFFDLLDLGRGVGIDISPRLGGDLGTVFVDGNGGLVLRLGNYLPRALPPRVNPSATGAGKTLRPGSDGIGWYIFGGFEARAVARNLFLDGALFSGGHSVAKKAVVREASLGIALSYRRVALSYTFVIRSKEFDLQPDGQSFGAINLSLAL